MANGELELNRTQLEQFLTLCLPLHPTPSDSPQHVLVHHSPIALPAERPPSPSPPAPLDNEPTASGDGHTDAVSSMNGSASAEERLQAAARRFHRSHVQALPSPVLTFATALALHSSSTDTRDCAFCRLQGDLSTPSSAGRLLPAHPFHPLLSFVHVQCALWSSQPFGTVSEFGQMSGVFQAIARTHNTICSHCNQPRRLAALPSEVVPSLVSLPLRCGCLLSVHFGYARLLCRARSCCTEASDTPRAAED